MELMVPRAANLWRRLLLARRDLPAGARENLRALDGLSPWAPAAKLSYTVFDLELTGLSPEEGRVVSVGAVRIRDGLVELSSAFHEYVNPKVAMDPELVTLHGITPGQVEEARSLGPVLEDFLAYLGRDILVAHNAEFDVAFVNRFMRRRYGFGLQNVIIDTLRLCRALLPAVRTHSAQGPEASPFGLDNMTKQFDIKVGVRHTALGDSLMTAMLLQRLLDKLNKSSPGRLKDLMRRAAVWPR